MADDGLYRALFDGVDDGLCLIEMIFDEAGAPVDYLFLRVNPSFERHSGIRDAEGRRALELVPGLEKRWFELYGAVAATGVPLQAVEEAKELGGRCFEVYAFRVGGPGSRRVAVKFKDVTKRVVAERALRESEERFRRLFESVEDGFCIVEVLYEAEKAVDFRFVVVNPAFEGQTGLRDAQGKTIKELTPAIEDFWIETYAAVVATGEPAHLVREAKPLGRWFDVRAARLGGPGSRTVAVTFSNATDRMRSEESIKRRNEELDAKVTERTVELTAANAELESFCYSVSHDLRAPLRGIEGFTSLLERDLGASLPQEAKEHLVRVRAAARRMSSIIDSLLDLSRLSRGAMKVEEVDLSAFAEEIGGELAKSHPGRRVERVVAPGLRAEGDPKLLRAALQNLLDNAWKFTERRETARIEFGRQNGGREAFFVRDDGAGFDMEYGGKLFRPFERLHRADEYPGTGIGLATVKRIIKRHGGEVWGEGAPGRGAVFFFTLPWKK